MSDPQNIIKGTSASETIKGSSQNDRIISSGGADTIFGYQGDDQLNGYALTSGGFVHWGSSDFLKIYGGQGNDFIVGGSDKDQLFGESGNDSINGLKGDDLLKGEEGSDSLYGGDGNDLLEGGIGDDALWGASNDDRLYGGSGNDYLDGGIGNDYLEGNDGDDELYGDVKDKAISGNDTLIGGNGADYLSGDAGEDALFGGPDNDRLYGGDGDDTLDGGTGFDQLAGGDGDDHYVINSSAFELSDSSGRDSATVNIDYVKIPSTIEVVNYETDIRPLPYWVSALLFDDAARYSTLLGPEKTFYFGFPKSLVDYSYPLDEKESNGWQAFSREQQRDTREIFKYIESVIDIRFIETTKFDQENTIAFGNNIQTAGAFAMSPGKLSKSSDVFIGILDDGSYKVPFEDGFRFANVFIHEIGHALGLKHPFDAPNASGKKATPPYLQGDENNAIWTQMSYSGEKNSYEFSPLDIAALQYLYGVESTTNSQDNVYVYSEVKPNFIWDGAGVDTINASSSSQPVTIFLSPGYHGFNGLTKKYELITSPGQITINFGTLIENLVGSKFSDVLTGNDLNNFLTGGAGSDVINGGVGIDTAIYEINRSDATINKTIGYQPVGSEFVLGSAWSVMSDGDTDSLKNVERLKFKDSSVALDVDGNAGKTVKLLSALLGVEGSSNLAYVGAGLSALDNGMSYESLMQAGLEFVLGSAPSSSAVIDLFYKNLVGSSAPESILKEYSALLDDGSLTSSGLGIEVAEHSLNAVNINLVGLAETGIEYI